ncbi:NADH-quinone oxidoreductase subunit M, partial [Pseudoxanthomonas sp. SGD-10]
MNLLLVLLFFPILGALVTLVSGKYAKQLAFVSSLVSLALALGLLCSFNPEAGKQFTIVYPWITKLGIYFTAGVDGISMVMLLLTTGLLPLIILSTFKRQIEKPSFYALMLFMQFGLQLVFTAMDAFLFYVGWEAALIPIYFICALWGGEDRIKVNMKFFIYTIAGSLFMLLGIIYLYLQTPSATFSLDAFFALNLPQETQSWL